MSSEENISAVRKRRDKLLQKYHKLKNKQSSALLNKTSPKTSKNPLKQSNNTRNQSYISSSASCSSTTSSNLSEGSKDSHSLSSSISNQGDNTLAHSSETSPTSQTSGIQKLQTWLKSFKTKHPEVTLVSKTSNSKINEKPGLFWDKISWICDSIFGDSFIGCNLVSI